MLFLRMCSEMLLLLLLGGSTVNESQSMWLINWSAWIMMCMCDVCSECVEYILVFFGEKQV